MNRAIFSAVGRRLGQRHKAWYTPGLGPELGEAASLLELTDWCLGAGCCCHDVQNSVKWSLASSLPAHAQATQELHIVIEALRNSFLLLVCRLPAFLSGHLAFSNEPYDVEQVAPFWRALGIETHMAEQIADISPWWSEGRLWVNGSLAQDPDSMQKISCVLLYMSKWRRFCDSRWITVGPCCRSLIWCLLCGPRRLGQHDTIRQERD